LSGAKYGIRRDHPIVLHREEDGLGMLLKKYVQRAAFQKSISPLDIIGEIKDMHNLLFKYVFPGRGEYRIEEGMSLPPVLDAYPRVDKYQQWRNWLSCCLVE